MEKVALEKANRFLNQLRQLAPDTLSHNSFLAIETKLAKLLFSHRSSKESFIQLRRFNLNLLFITCLSKIFFKIILSKIHCWLFLETNELKTIALYYHVLNHYKTILPLYNESINKSLIVSLISKNSFRKKNKNIVYIESFCSFSLIIELIIKCNSFIKQISRLTIKSPVTKKVLLNYFEQIFMSEFYCLMANVFLKKTGIKKHIFADDGGQNFRAMVLTMNEREDVHTFLIQHGVIADKLMYYSACQNIFVWGHKSKKVLIDMGINVNRVIITGSPRIDQYLSNYNKHSSQCNKPIKICFFSTPDHQFPIMLRECINNLKNEENIKLFLKLHPVEKKKNIKSLKII